MAWQDTLRLIFSQPPKVYVVEEYDRIINCPSMQMKVPAVVVLVKYYDIYNFYKIRFSNRALYARDHYTCCYCGVKLPGADLTKDHVIPRAHFKAGKAPNIRETGWTNIVSACKNCNSRKGARTPGEAGMKLLYDPYEPSFVSLNFHAKMPKEWLPYIKG
jgi:5-methylcytosine-specific restriction endonuclease McrA